MAKDSKKLVQAITSQEENFAQWYTDICVKAELVEYSSVKGFIILRPYGQAIWELIQKDMDARFKATGHENVAMPVLIPESLLQKEGELVNGFAPEVAWVTMGGSDKLEERLAVRPTSETMFCDHWSRVLHSYRELPMKYNQWCSVVRWEKTTRPFLRSREFWWQEGHTIHETSYDLMRRDEELYSGQQFYACILDEAQAIKNHTTQKYKAVCGVNSKVRFALTGTPVENRLGELWSIFSFLMPGYLPPYKTFCARFEKPIVQEDDKDALRRLNQLTGPFILRRMKSEVLKELPPKTENLHRIELDEQQRKLYLAAVVDAREKLRAAKPEDKMAVFAVLMRLREICCDPRLVADNWDGGSAKLEACMELVTAAVEGGHRILLFSQFTSMLELLAKRLDEAGVSHFTLQGSTPKPVRAELVRRFNSGEADVFLISLRAGGTGLNLTAADIVIHYDPWWNVAAQNQATDRAYRIGQRNPVQVYKLIAQDTIEEKIVELQQAKQDLAETVTGSADGAILSMKPEELLQLLQEE